MDQKLGIILLSTLIPAAAVAYVLRTNGKRLNFAVWGGVVVYLASVAMILLLFWASSWIHMPATDLILLLPFGIAVIFYWLFRGSKLGNE